jgi:hypothetical protein
LLGFEAGEFGTTAAAVASRKPTLVFVCCRIEQENQFEVKADIPGVTKNDIKVAGVLDGEDGRRRRREADGGSCMPSLITSVAHPVPFTLFDICSR